MGESQRTFFVTTKASDTLRFLPLKQVTIRSATPQLCERRYPCEDNKTEPVRMWVWPYLSKKVCMLMSLKKVWANFRISARPHRITAAFVFEDNLKVREATLIQVYHNTQRGEDLHTPGRRRNQHPAPPRF
jgi:hypothetical protein